MDNEKIDLPYEAGTKFSIKKLGFNIMVETDCHLSLRWNQEGGMAILTMPKSYGNDVEGLCGKCNGKKDEWLVKGGEDIAEDEDRFRKIGASFAVLDGDNT